MSSSLKYLVEEWLRLDQDPITYSEIKILWTKNKLNELEQRMRPRIEFGTAGLRGRMEAGWARMNDLTVIQASQGLCQYVLANVTNATSRGIVIGYDHRHNSKHWASLTAAVFIENGCKAFLYREYVHTPLVPFGVKKLNAACGVMVTASHNPKEDNGYKVYWENAVQVVAPHDAGISKSIKANLEPKTWSTTALLSSDLFPDHTKTLIHDYFSLLASLNLHTCHHIPLDVKFVNTSMHGVSDPFVRKAFEMFGFPPFIPVKEQQQPDPEFPTVQFPNPEEKGALDLALSTAEKHGAKYVLAQDPDSDRFSAAERLPSGRWINFTGDQLGTLFASQVLERYKNAGKPIRSLAVVASTVSSKMVEAMSRVEGFKFVECLTGFKYIGNTAIELQKQGYEVPFGYEEAIGFMFGDNIRDKDGVAATICFAKLVLHLHSQGKTVHEYLEELYQRYGYFKVCIQERSEGQVFIQHEQSSNSYFICSDPATTGKIFDRIRNLNKSSTRSEETRSYPTEIAGIPITRVTDLTLGYDSTNPPFFKPSLPLSSGQMIQFQAESPGVNGISLMLTIRTSGTEPKVKFYLEGSGRDAHSIETMLPRVVAELGDEWMEAGRHQLRKP